MTHDTPTVTVVGGGIGGVAAAAALLHRGIDVHVYEQAAEITEIGAGVMVTPNSLRLMNRIGAVGEAVAACGGMITDGSVCYRQDGTPVTPFLTTDSGGWNGMRGMHRADLLEALRAAVPADRQHVDHRCVGFAQDGDGAEVRFADGTTVRSDVVIAADGLHSTLQSEVVAGSVPHDAGSVSYRVLVPAHRVPEWNTSIMQVWMGEGRHMLVFPVRRGELLNVVSFVPSTASASESWTAQGDIESLRGEFAGWDPRITELLAVADGVPNRQGLYDREPLDRWVNGRLALLGDAAHPMLPHVGQGANQAIEDAVALSVFLEGATGATAPQALRDYARLRRERTNQVQAGSRENGRRYDSEFDDLDERDADLTANRRFRLWLFDYDAEQAARKALSVR